MQSRTSFKADTGVSRRSSSAATAYHHRPLACMMGLLVFFAAMRPDHASAKNVANRLLPEYDFCGAQHGARHQYDDDEGNSSRRGGWHRSRSTPTTSSDYFSSFFDTASESAGQHETKAVVEDGGCHHQTEQPDVEDRANWVPSDADDITHGGSSQDSQNGARGRSRSRRRRSLSRRRGGSLVVSVANAAVGNGGSPVPTPALSATGTPSTSSDTDSAPTALSAVASSTISPSVLLGATAGCVSLTPAIGGAHEQAPVPPTGARFLPLPADFERHFAVPVASNPSERAAIPWACGVCNTADTTNAGTKSVCKECHAPFDRSAVRVFIGQLRKEHTAEHALWIISTLVPTATVLHVEAHTTRNEQRNRGAAFVHLASTADLALVMESLNKRVFADVHDGREGVWLVESTAQEDALAIFSQRRAVARSRPMVLPRQPLVVERAGKPQMAPSDVPFRPWASVAASTTPAVSSLFSSFASPPQQVVANKPQQHDPYAWNPFPVNFFNVDSSSLPGAAIQNQSSWGAAWQQQHQQHYYYSQNHAAYGRGMYTSMAYAPTSAYA